MSLDELDEGGELPDLPLLSNSSALQTLIIYLAGSRRL